MTKGIFGAEIRRVENREHLGKAALAAVLIRSYDTTVEDLWDAITNPVRLARWFLPIEGDLKRGGRYQLKGNAGGTITRCERPKALDVTWEMFGATSWVNLRLAAAGKKARLTLEHIAPKDGPGEEHLKKYGPGAVGVGWDLGLYGLELYLPAPDVALDHATMEGWMRSEEGKVFMRSSGEAWGEAHAASGEDPEEARARAQRTIAFYTGS
jgi:uncharacterized protein YndB with AHSA1/START domain